MPLEMTERAAQEVRTVISQQNMDPERTYLRVGVKGGGCSGFEYVLDLAAQKAENDEEWELHGLKVICDPKSNIYLDGVTVDFRDSLMGRGFTFNNPNATNVCGCGSSFGA